MLWLCAYFPQLGLEVCSADYSDSSSSQVSSQVSKKKPTVLLADNRVTQRNALARDRGIHIGTSLAAAHSIAADLVHLQRNPEKERQRLNYLSEVLYGFSSHVSIDSTPGGYLDDPGNTHHSVVLEISSSLRLFGGLNALLKAVYQQLITLNHGAFLQVAHTPLAAQCAARWRYQRRHSCPHESKKQPAECSAQNLPRVLPENLSALASMPLDCLALSPRQGESLHNMGLRNCGALLQLPSKELGTRFGKELGNYLQRLTGAAPDPRPPIKPPQDFSSSVHLLEPCTSKTALLFPVKRLCHEFSHWLIAQQLGVCLLHWQFANSADAPVTLAVRTTRASQAGELLLKLTQLQLERCELPRDVLDIRLDGIELEPWQNHSDSLFPHLQLTGSAENSTPLTELLDQLRARLGPNVCSGISVQHRHRPEQAWQMKPLQRVSLEASKPKSRKKTQRRAQAPKKAQTPKKDSDSPAAAEGAIGKYRPTWLLPEPRPIARRTLCLLHGPERLQGGWWQDQRMRRDYYIAQTKAQQRDSSYSWVFCEGERWFVHGYFG